jgi:hypothetical protein
MTMLRSSMSQQIAKSVGSKKKKLKTKGYNLGGLKEGSRKRTTNNKRKPR